MRQKLNYHHLYYFQIIAKEGSIKKSCEKLNLTPSALSTQLKQFEDSIGIKLFQRKVRKLVLNEAGKIAQLYAAKIFALGDELLNTLQNEDLKPTTVIRIGVIPSLSKSHTNEFVIPFLRHRGITVKVIEAELDELLYKFKNLELDIILSDQNIEKNYRKCTTVRLKPRKIIAVANQDFLQFKKGFPFSLNELPYIQLTSHSEAREEIDLYFKERDIKPKVIGEADDVSLLISAAETGVCFSVVPENSAAHSLESKTLYKLGQLSGVNSDMWAAIHKNCPYTELILKTAKKFVDQNESHARK